LINLLRNGNGATAVEQMNARLMRRLKALEAPDVDPRL
jgi:hypothetical protein